MRSPTRALAGVVAALAALATLASTAAAVGPLARPAGAHEGEAVIEVESEHPSGSSVHYVVRVVWDDDGHPATGATVTATAVGPDGEVRTPVTLAPADADGRYEGTVELPAPGTWTVRFTSIGPNGAVEHTQEITAPSTTTTAADTAAGAAAAPAAGDDVAADEAARTSEAASDDGMPGWVIALAAVVAVGGVATALLLVRRHRAPGHETS